MKRLFLICICILSLKITNAQTNGFVYGISTPSPNSHWFGKLELSTGIYTALTQMPWTSYSSASSSVADVYQGLYIHCTTTDIFKIDPQSGSYTSFTLPIAAGAGFVQMQFNPCDSMIYGVVNDYPNAIYFAKYNPINDSFYNIAALSLQTMFCSGCTAALDPLNQIYYKLAGGELTGISCATGQIVSQVMITNLSGEIFNHISYDCVNGRIVGTSFHSVKQEKILATVDPTTGNITAISSTAWVSGLWKPSTGGNGIDFVNGIYYYSGAPDVIIGIDLNTGDSLTVQPTGNGAFQFLQYFSQCPCTPLAVSESSEYTVKVYPNPCRSVLTFETTTNENQLVVIYDATGREMMRGIVTTSISCLNVESLSPGFYLWRMSNGSNGQFSRIEGQ